MSASSPERFGTYYRVGAKINVWNGRRAHAHTARAKKQLAAGMQPGNSDLVVAAAFSEPSLDSPKGPSCYRTNRMAGLPAPNACVCL